MPNIDMDISLFIFRNILRSYYLSTSYSHHLINKRDIFKLASVVVSRTRVAFLMKYFKAAFSEQFYCFCY